jgi:hypothetical protein
LAPYDFGTNQSSLLGFFQCLVSVPGCLFASVILYGRRWLFNRFSLLNIGVIFVSTLVFHMSFLNLKVNDGLKVELVAILVNGFFISSFTSYIFEYAIDLAPEVSEAMSCGIITLFINSFTFVEIVIFSAYYDEINLIK